MTQSHHPQIIDAIEYRIQSQFPTATESESPARFVSGHGFSRAKNNHAVGASLLPQAPGSPASRLCSLGWRLSAEAPQRPKPTRVFALHHPSQSCNLIKQ
jgi:hypothetical protein